MGWGDLPVFRLKQVHGKRVLTLDGPGAGPSRREEGDGLATARRGIVVVVAAADCVPLILFDPRNRAGAVLHAGWRGTLGAIAAEGVRALREGWGGRPSDLLALIGPSVGPCCYSVGGEVVQAFLDAGPSGAPLGRQDSGAFHLDLPALNRFQLERAGLEPGRILTAGLCTSCRADLFPSYRREGPKAGRLLAFLGSAPSP